MAPEDVPSHPALLRISFGGGDVASRGEEVVYELSAFLIEGVPQVKIGYDERFAALKLLR